MADMPPGNDAEQEQLERLASGGALSSALLFGILALVAAFILAPVLDSGTQHVANLPQGDGVNPIDATVTGSVSPQLGQQPTAESGKIRYTIRRSVIQKNPSEPCYIYADGTRKGDC
ncbi:MAG: hypothetical protein ACR2O8_09575 [Rhizobiaceae bacterium]